MSVTVNFYNNKSENIDTNKTLEPVANKTIIFKADVNILTPEVILSDNIECNYAYIADFGRYYFVTKNNITGGRFRYDFKVDVAQTYKNQIKGLFCTVLRNEKVSQAYLHDSEYRTLAYKNYVTKSFPKGFTTDSIILNCIGGA